MQASAFGQFPTPEYGSILEDFDIVAVSGPSIDSGGANNETIKRPDGPSTSNFAWGAYNAAIGSGINFMRNSAVNHPNPPPPPELTALTFWDASRSVGSYVYTVFDKSANDGNNNMPTITLNMSGEGAKVTVKTVQNGDTGLALLIRSGASTWYQSDSKLLTASPDWHVDPPIGTTDYEFTGPLAVSWSGLSGTNDMDEVDDGGETALTVVGPATPDFSNITGVGVRITSVAGSTGGFSGLTVTEIELDGPGEPPPPLAAAENWNDYR